MSRHLPGSVISTQSLRVATPVVLQVGDAPRYILRTSKDGRPVITTKLLERKDKFERWIRAVWRTLVMIFLLFSTGMIVVGAMFVYQCSGNKFIPTYMIVSGVIGLLQFVIMIYDYCAADPNRRTLTGRNTVYSCTNVSFALFLGWTFFGSILILTTSIQTQDPNADYYCHDILYLVAYFAAAMFDILYITLGITGFLTLCLCGLLTPGAYMN